FGWSVAVSGDTALVGAPEHQVGSNTHQGAAYLRNVTQATAMVTVTVTTPSAVTATSGGGQSATVATAFASPLVATVTDAHGAPAPGVTVPSAALGGGAGVTFAGGNTATTNAQGRASVTLIANGTAGSYTVTASVAGVSTPAAFALTNNSPPKPF